MPDPNPVTQIPAGTVTPAASASKPAVPQEPAKPVQQTPPVQGVPPKPEGDKPGQTVPLPELLEERSKRQALEAELAILRQPPSQQQPQGVQQQPPNQIAVELDKMWDSDPRKAVQMEIGLAIDWFDRVNNTIDQEADRLSSKYSDFNDWRSQATRYIRSLPLNQRGMQGALEMAYFVVRGQNVDHLLKRQNDDLVRKFQTGELAGMVSTPAGMTGNPPPINSPQATDEQRNAANAMGMPVEEYLKYVRTPGGR